MRFSQQHFTEITVTSVTIIAFLILANLVKFNILPISALARNKDAIDAISTLITSVVILLGATASYFRFFRGRTFGQIVQPEISLNSYKVYPDYFLHVIDVTVKNVGTFAIWEPEVNLKIYKHGLEQIGQEENVDFWRKPAKEELLDNTIVINPQESISFSAFYKLPIAVAITTYVVVVRLQDGTVWEKAITHADNKAA